MFGFHFGLIMEGLIVIFPTLYLMNYGAICFDAWRFGRDRPRHKVIVNIILALVLGFALGGLVQYQWDYFAPCFSSGGNIVTCLISNSG